MKTEHMRRALAEVKLATANFAATRRAVMLLFGTGMIEPHEQIDHFHPYCHAFERLKAQYAVLADALANAGATDADLTSAALGSDPGIAPKAAAVALARGTAPQTGHVYYKSYAASDTFESGQDAVFSCKLYADVAQYSGLFPKSLKETILCQCSKLSGDASNSYLYVDGGRKYVAKYYDGDATTANARLLNECGADLFYLALGVGVPRFRIYRRDRGKSCVKLSEFIPHAKHYSDLDKDGRKVFSRELVQNLAADVLLANWSVVGAKKTITALFEPDPRNPRVVRCDSSGALRYRAGGAQKPDWEQGRIAELWTMTGKGEDVGMPAVSPLTQLTDEVRPCQLAREIALRRNIDENLDIGETVGFMNAAATLPRDVRDVVVRRMNDAERVADWADQLEGMRLSDREVDRRLAEDWKNKRI